MCWIPYSMSVGSRGHQSRRWRRSRRRRRRGWISDEATNDFIKPPIVPLELVYYKCEIRLREISFHWANRRCSKECKPMKGFYYLAINSVDISWKRMLEECVRYALRSRSWWSVIYWSGSPVFNDLAQAACIVHIVVTAFTRVHDVMSPKHLGKCCSCKIGLRICIDVWIPCNLRNRTVFCYT